MYLVERDGLGQRDLREEGGEGKLPVVALDQPTLHQPGQVAEATDLLAPAAGDAVAAPEREEGVGRELLRRQRHVQPVPRLRGRRKRVRG